MKKIIHPAGRIKIGLAVLLLTAMTGCVGYVDGGYGGGVVVAQPDVFLFGDGYYEGGRDVHGYSQRGYSSHAAAHYGGGGHRR